MARRVYEERRWSPRGEMGMAAAADVPQGASFVLFLLGLVFFSLGVFYINASTKGTRETEVLQYSGAISNWTAFRPTFASLALTYTLKLSGGGGYLTEKSNGTETTSGLAADAQLWPEEGVVSTHGALRVSTEGDPIFDEEAANDGSISGDLPTYKPLKYEGDASAPEGKLFNFSAAPWVEIEVDAGHRSGGGGPSSTFSTGPFPSTRVYQVYAPKPAPETKCKQMHQGLYDVASGKCFVYQKISGICVQVEADPSGHWQLHSVLLGNDSSSATSPPSVGAEAALDPTGDAPTYGCDPGDEWFPAQYSTVKVEGYDTRDVVVPPIGLNRIKVLVRSRYDPFLHLEVMTNSTDTLALSSRSSLIAGCTFLLLSVLLMINPACRIYQTCCCGREVSEYERDSTYYGRLREDHVYEEEEEDDDDDEDEEEQQQKVIVSYNEAGGGGDGGEVYGKGRWGGGGRAFQRRSEEDTELSGEESEFCNSAPSVVRHSEIQMTEMSLRDQDDGGGGGNSGGGRGGGAWRNAPGYHRVASRRATASSSSLPS